MSLEESSVPKSMMTEGNIQPVELNDEDGNGKVSDGLPRSDNGAFLDDNKETINILETTTDLFESLPDHLIIEILVHVPTSSWLSLVQVRKRWALLFHGEMLWQTALAKRWPRAGQSKRWPGPISQGSSKRRYTALTVSKKLFHFGDEDGDVDELSGHVYLFLKEQFETCASPPPYGLLHGTIVDQFLACGKPGGTAHELACQIWLAVIDNLEETEHTFHLLMRIAEEWEVFLPYPYSKSQCVQWKLFERLFTDFRDCLRQTDYYNVLTLAKHKFEFIPPTWMGY